MKFLETARIVNFKIEFEPGEAPLERTHWFGRTQSNDQAELVSLEYTAQIHPGNNNQVLVQCNGFAGVLRSLKDPQAMEWDHISNRDLAPELMATVREELARRMDEHMGSLVRG